MEDRPIRLAILESQAILRDALAATLQAEGMVVATSQMEPAPFLEEALAHPPDLAILGLPHTTDAGEALAHLVQTLRLASPTMKIVVLSPGLTAAEVFRLYQEGANGYLSHQTTDRRALVAAVRAVTMGQSVYPVEFGPQFEPPRAVQPPEDLAELTPRQKQVLGCVGAGYDNQAIANLLKITERTVKSHLTSLYKHFRTSSRVYLALQARRLKPAEGSPAPVEELSVAGQGAVSE
jgi:DNA-binding NarL/FixJ family response regulator